MSKHTTYRGQTIDMGSMMRENETVPAIGNMGVNARGDKLERGKVTKTADQMARERGRVQSVLLNTGLKGPMPSSNVALDQAKPATATPVPVKKVKEKELPSGDIIIEEEE